MADTPSSATSALPTRNVKFDDLRLGVDHRLQLETPISKDPIHARLLGYLKGSTLIVRPQTTQPGGAIPFNEGDNLVVRGFSGRIAFAFNSVVEKIRYTPYPYCHLKFPASIRGAEIRKAVRIRANLPTKVINARLGGDYPMEATISDLSAAGAQLTAATPLGQVGDTLTLTFRFWIPPNDYEVNLQTGAIIQTAAPFTEESASGMQYGVRFEGLRSTETILLQNLIYQQLQENPGTRI